MRQTSCKAARAAAFALLACGAAAWADAAVGLPMGRQAYVVGEKVPIALRGSEGKLRLEAVDASGVRLPLYEGKAQPLVLDTAGMAPGRYTLQLDGKDAGVGLTLASPIRRSAGAITDESLPSPPQLPPEVSRDPARRAAAIAAWRERVPQVLAETGIDAAFAMCGSEMGREPLLDPFTAAGTMLFINPYTRPMSFNPARVYAPELGAFRQRLALMAQANSRYPAFGGFCFGFDPTGFLGRKMLLFYWGWGQQEAALRAYIDRSDQAVYDEFTRRTGLKPVTTEDYATYLLSIGRPEFAPAIDLPTARWLEEMARCLKPLDAAKRAELETRIDAWSAYLMGLYEETYRGHLALLRPLFPSMHHTSTVNIDHCPVRMGQYVPSAYRPLDFRYITAWNDQVAGPDYAYQWLFSAAMLDTNREGEPIWVGTSLGMAHGQADYPGKFVRVIAHNLAHGASGAGFALEGFSTVLGGMNKQTHWDEMKGKPIAEGLRAGRDFLNRFAFLAIECQADYGVGILYSKNQMARQHVSQGLGTHAYKALVSLTRLGYTPRFVTEEEIAEHGIEGVKALVVVGQTFPLPEKVVAGIEAFAKRGGRVLADGSTTLKLPAAEPLGVALPFQTSGRPHNWSSPNIPEGGRHIDLVEAWHRELAPALLKALGETGRARLRPEKGADSRVTVMEIDGGRDAKYAVCVNDSSIKSHTDWVQVTERLLPSREALGSIVYDLNQEKVLGGFPRGDEKVIARIELDLQCDLSATTARVFALLPCWVKRIAVRANQSLRAGERLVVRVGFEDARGRTLAAALPFGLSLLRPDRSAAEDLYRSTARDGSFGMAYEIPINAPAGEWKVAVRSQLTGDVAELPITVRPPRRLRALAEPIEEKVIVRNGQALREALGAKGSKVIVPLFDTPHLIKLLPAAERLKQVLARRGIEAEIRRKPELTTYWLAYDPTPEQLAENARADKGETIGKIKVTTVNRNDYYATLGGYAVGENVVSLDLATRQDNEMAEHLARVGALWPEASADFPGPGRAIVHCVPGAFHPDRSAIVIQAGDAAGLMAGVEALRRPPEDWLAESVASAREALFREFHIAGSPPSASKWWLTSRGLAVRHEPKPFAFHFLGPKPIAESEVQPPPPRVHKPLDVPAAIECNDFVPQLKTSAGYEDAWTPGKGWKADLRFADATLVVLDVQKPGRTAVAAEGTFRYSDRRPRSQALWEDLLALRDRIVPKKREPMAFDVLLDGKPAGRLDKLATATRDVPLDSPAWHGTEKPKTASEEVAIRVSGEVDLPAGQHRLLLIHRNIVDGRLEKLHIGVEPAAEAGEKR